MRVLLDQNCPQRIARELTGHDVATARGQGWSALSNGDLLQAAESAGFEVLLTADKRIRYQQNLQTRRIALVVLSLNNLAVLLQHTARLRDAVAQARPGSYEEVDLPRPALIRRPPPQS